MDGPTDLQVDTFAGAEVRCSHKDGSLSYQRVGELDETSAVRPSRFRRKRHVECSAAVGSRNDPRSSRIHNCLGITVEVGGKNGSRFRLVGELPTVNVECQIRLENNNPSESPFHSTKKKAPHSSP